MRDIAGYYRHPDFPGASRDQTIDQITMIFAPELGSLPSNFGIDINSLKYA